MVLNSQLYLLHSKRVLYFYGIWPQANNHIILRKIWLTLVMTSQYSFLLFEFIYVLNVWGDMDQVSEASYLLFTQASLCYKTTAFMVNKNNLVELLERMDCDIFQPKSDVHDRILARHAVRTVRLSMVFLVSASMSCALWGCTPLFDKASAGTFPFRIWMPVTPSKSPQYEVGYLYQMVSIFTSAFLFIAVDSVVANMVMFGCAQLEIIMDKISMIENVECAPPSVKKLNEKIESNNQLLVECIKQHQTLDKFIKLVEDTYHANIFFQLASTALIICNTGLRISAVDQKSVQFSSMVSYLVTIMAQLFQYCWCGHELTIRSEALRDCLYQCPWYEQDIRFRRSLWIAMERMKRQIVFKVGHYIPLSRPTFVSIMRCSYSYFAVLNRT